MPTAPVTQRRIDLAQGGQLSEAAVETAKERFRELLEQGDVAGVEASLRPESSMSFRCVLWRSWGLTLPAAFWSANSGNV